MTYKIRVPIGDWSDDGHGKCEWFVVESSKPIEAMFDAHFNAEKKLKICIGDIIGEYEEPWIKAKELMALITNGIIKKAFPDVSDDDIRELIENAENEEEISALFAGTLKTKESDLKLPWDSFNYTEDLLTLWLEILKFGDPELELKIVSDKEMPRFISWSTERREFSGPGYGLFY